MGQHKCEFRNHRGFLTDFFQTKVSEAYYQLVNYWINVPNVNPLAVSCALEAKIPGSFLVPDRLIETEGSSKLYLIYLVHFGCFIR